MTPGPDITFPLEMLVTTAQTVLETATNLVGGERARTHGDKLANHEKIARLWNAHLENRLDPAAPLSALDVALMMGLLKIARVTSGTHNPDNYVDLAGYAAVAGEIAERAG